MKDRNGPVKLDRAIGFAGFLGMGIGCVFGSSWLLMTGMWLTASGGPLNAMLAFGIGLVMLLILAAAYTRIMPLFPECGGEMRYARQAYGDLAGLVAGWCGFLVNGVICAWQTLAFSKMLHALLPTLGAGKALYVIGGQPVTLTGLTAGLVLTGVIAATQYLGTKFFSRIQVVLMAIVITTVLAAFAVGAVYFDAANWAPMSVKPTLEGTISLLVLLPFSIAGWENISKGVEEASAGLSLKRIGLAMTLSIVISTILYAGLMLVQAGLMPWQSLTQSEVPFADSLVTLTGVPLLRGVLLTAALINIVGVFNGMFYGAVRSLYALSAAGLIPHVFARVHPTYRTPATATLFVAAVIGTAPFIGSAIFGALVNVAAFFYILLWGSVVLSLRRLEGLTRSGGSNHNRLGSLSGLGVAVALLLTLAMLHPASPGALSWPTEYLLLSALIGSGFLFYAVRPRPIQAQEGSPADGLEPFN